jgi:hypothetical protein
MYLFSAPRDALPVHRSAGLAASLTLHFTAFALIAAIPPVAAPIAERQIAVVGVPASAVAGDIAPSDDAGPWVEEQIPPADAFNPTQLQLDRIAVDVGKIVRHRDALFPFVTARLPFLDAVADRDVRPDELINPFGRERAASPYPPLILSPAERERIVDRAWSRRTRWDSFREIAALLRKHDPSLGDAAGLVRSHVDQNLLQPYFDAATRDPRYWVMLGLAADHAPFIDFIASYMREHPSSRTTIELLFMLDEFAQASRDTMLMLLASDPAVVLQDTFEADRDAFDFAQSLYRQYRDWARREGLHDTDTIRARFDDIRIGILRTIIASAPDGYGASDARYLIGLIEWDRNDIQGALRWWRGLAVDGRDAYREATSAVTRELTRPGGGTVAAISSVLGAEYRRWLTFSAARLEQFGYGFDTF